MVPLLVLFSCSHSFDSDSLDLRYYQWNLWSDEDAIWNEKHTEIQEFKNSDPLHDPSCGWEDLHRGMGKLVRIPALMNDHLAGQEDGEGNKAIFRGVAWYHCRFTLPEGWQGKPIALEFEGAGPLVEVYLNETYVGGHRGMDTPFTLDVTGVIYYTRDNHLAIRITDPEGGQGGITGTIDLKPSEDTQPYNR
jgi:hypothetical protein